MLIFDTLTEFRAVLGGTKKWDRTLEAIDNIPNILPDVTYSVGDSLTYRLASAPDQVALTGHRRYISVRHVVAGQALIEVAPITTLLGVEPYDDLSDRQLFTGTGDQIRLAAGAVLVCEIDEAMRDVAVDGSMVTLRVTVEGAFFANK